MRTAEVLEAVVARRAARPSATLPAICVVCRLPIAKTETTTYAGRGRVHVGCFGTGSGRRGGRRPRARPPRAS